MSYVFGQAYRRGFGLVIGLPLLIAVPVLAEAAQHGAEMYFGIYSGGMDTCGKAVRLGFGAIKILAIFADDPDCMALVAV